MITTIIFSKNRACQLDLLLRSLEQNFKHISTDIWVLFYADSADFHRGYDKLINRFPGVAWWTQLSNSFQKDTMTLLNRAKEYVCFFVDDNIVYQSPNLYGNQVEYVMNNVEDAGYFSFRLGLNTVIQDPYANTKVNPMPKFVEINGLVLAWDWTTLPTYDNNFGYPFSVDGNVYNKKFVLDYMDYEFDTPNGFEGRFPLHRVPRCAFCLKQSCVVNNPLNLVGSSTNKAGVWHGHSLEELNEKYLDGQRIAFHPDSFPPIVGCHQEIEVYFEQ